MRCQSSSVERAAHVARNHVSWVVTGTTPSFWRVQAEPWRGKGDSLEIINVKPSTIRHHSVSVPTTCRHIVRLAARRIPLQTRPSGTPTPRCVLQPPGASGSAQQTHKTGTERLSKRLPKTTCYFCYINRKNEKRATAARWLFVGVSVFLLLATTLLCRLSSRCCFQTTAN